MSVPMTHGVALRPTALRAPSGEHDRLQSFRTLFASHARDLERYAHRIVRSREAAQDVVQDVFLLLWLARERVEVGAGTRSYLYLTTRARAINYLKRARRERRYAEREALGVGREEPALGPEGEARVEGDEVGMAIERVLATMPARQRRVAELRLRGQRTTAEIAEELGMSRRTVELHVARATRALRTHLPALLGASWSIRG